jgi:hypothetical protein
MNHVTHHTDNIPTTSQPAYKQTFLNFELHKSLKRVQKKLYNIMSIKKHDSDQEMENRLLGNVIQHLHCDT